MMASKMTIFTLLYIILNIIVAIKTRNLEPTEETYYDDVDDHITYKDSLNKFYLKNAPSSKIYESDLVEIQERRIKPWYKTKRSAIEENKMSFVSLKPTRRERHRGSLKQDEHLKLPHFKIINKTIDKTDDYNNEVMKSNTYAYTFEERNDNSIKKANDTTIHHSLSDEMENSDLDIKKDILIQSMRSYPKNVLEMSRFSNENIGVNNTQSSSYIARNDNTKVIGIIDMPSKYISVVPKTMIPNTKSEIATINDQMINKNINNQEEIIERYDTEIIAEQYDQEPNQINIKSLETNGNNNQNLLRAGQIFQHQVLMEANDARFLAEQNKDNPNLVNKFYQKLLRTVPRLDHQELMERSGAGFVTEQYNEDYANKQHNTDQKLLRARQENNHKELMESHSSGLIAKQYEDYLNQPHNMYEKNLRSRQENNHQERMESTDPGIIAGKYYNEDRNRPNRKSIEINGRIRQIRPRIDLQEPMERKDFKTEEEENDRDQDQEVKNLETNGHIYQKLLESSPRFDHQGLIHKERNDARIVADPYYNEDINRLNTKSIDIKGHIRHITPKFNHQELIERKSDRIEAEQYEKDTLNAKTMDSNKHNYQKSLESKPRFNHQEIMEKNNSEFEAGEYAIHQNPSKMKSLETNGRNYQKISEARPSLDHQGLMERHGAGIIAEEYSKGDPNQRNIKSFTSHQLLIKEEGNNIIETEQNKRDPNESNMKSSEISNPNTIQNLSGAIERPEQQKLTEENDSKMFSEQYYEEYSNQLNMNPFGGIANIDEPIFENIGKPEKELKGRDNAEIVAKYREDLLATNMKAKDTSNSHMDKKFTEGARSKLKLMVLNNADIRHGAGPEHYKEYSNQPNTNSLDKNTNNHQDTFEGRNDKPINLDEKEVIDVIYTRLAHYIPRINPLVVIPRFEYRLVPSCSRFYLPKRCTILKIKCGLI